MNNLHYKKTVIHISWSTKYFMFKEFSLITYYHTNNNNVSALINISIFPFKNLV